MTLGEYIRTARNIHAFIYGEESVWNEVNVNLWIQTAQRVKIELKSYTFAHALKELQSIPENILNQINTTL